MLEIKLTGNEALEYIQYLASKKASNEQTTKNNINTPKDDKHSSMAFIEAKKANEINKPRKWTDTEIKAIEWAMKQPENTSHRKFRVLVNRLGRTEQSVYSKLNELGIRVKNGVLYYR